METGWSGAAFYLLVMALAMFWAVAEVLRSFENDPVRALRNGWTWVFFGVNAGFSALVYLIFQFLPIPSIQSLDPRLLALLVGVGWQTLLRTNINIIQPLNPEIGKAVALSIADQYARVQGFFLKRIDLSLAEDRMQWLIRAIDLPVAALEDSLRVFDSAVQTEQQEDIEAYIEKTKQLPEKQRKLRLANLLLDRAGYENFKSLVENMEGQHDR